MILDILFLAAIAFGMVYTLLLTIESWWTIHRRSPRPVLVGSPGITVFKPLKGVDDALEANLRSFFEQDYPRFQLLFGVQDADDPVIGIVEKLLRAYPQVRARLVVDGTETGLNPKINNLCNMYPYARHPHLLISDSNVRVGRDYLRGMMAALQQDGVGLVTSTIRGVGARSIGALMENLHLNTFVAGSVWMAEHLADMPIAIGKSMLFSRGTLERIGGFAAFREFLAEDYLLGEAVAGLGLRVTTLTAAVENVNRDWTLARFCNRHARWARIRKAVNPLTYCAELLTNPVAVAAVYALLRLDAAGLGLLAGTAALKTALDAGTTAVVGHDLPWHRFLLVPVKDLLVGLIWYLPWLSSRVVWRGREFRIRRQTRLEAVAPARVKEAA